MKCVNCGHERNFHIIDEGLSPCALPSCCCIEYLEEHFVDKNFAIREATSIVQNYNTKQKVCAMCKHDVDRHYDRPYLPIDDQSGRGMSKQCIVPGCGCEDFT